MPSSLMPRHVGDLGSSQPQLMMLQNARVTAKSACSVCLLTVEIPRQYERVLGLYGAPGSI